MQHDQPTTFRFSLTLYFNFALSLIFACTAFFLIYQINKNERQQALVEAEAKAQLILDRNLAIHSYFAHTLKPSVFTVTEGSRDPDYFDPAWMSSTYAVREIDKNFRQLNPERYYYKECAINARCPENEADDFEKAFLETLRDNPDVTYHSLVRKLGDEYYYVVLRRGEVMEESCLRCHSQPGAAPKALVDTYGPVRSFGRGANELVSAISIRIPLSAAYARADRFSRKLSTLFVLALAVLFLVQYFVFRALVLRPVNRLKSKARRFSEDETRLGETIELPASREFAELAAAFNFMSGKLRHHLDNLEEMVGERTSELKAANARLRSALDEIKTLQGILPICSSCKKIRDDQGYWNQLEKFIQEHSSAEFSHGICPECMKKLYPDLFPGPKKPEEES